MINLENADSFFSAWERELQDSLAAFENSSDKKLEDMGIVSRLKCSSYIKSAQTIQKNPKAPEKLKAQAKRIEELAKAIIWKERTKRFLDTVLLLP